MKEKLFENIMDAVVNGETKEVVSLVNEAMSNGIQAGDILNNALIAGMNIVGELFKDGEMFVPEVLMSAKALQASIEIVKPSLLVGDVKVMGKVLTVTVEGDLHDIGVKLVGMMLEGAGFEVVNMGTDKSAKEIVDKIKEFEPNILGMSAMLTTTMSNMKETIDILQEEGLSEKIKVMIGGAPTSPSFAQKIGAVYAADATEAVAIAKGLLGVA